MAEGKPPKAKRKKGARKKFFEVSIPLVNTKIHLYSYSPEDLEGNTVKLDLTKSLRGKNMELKAKVNLLEGKLFGSLTSLELAQSYVKKVVRRGTDYVEDSLDLECKDAKLKIKPLMVTRKRVSRAVLKAIRNTSKKTLKTYVTTKTSQEIFSDIMAGKLQKTLSQKIKKIYPLALCEIRVIRITEKIDKTKEKSTNSKEEDSSKMDKTEETSEMEESEE